MRFLHITLIGVLLVLVCCSGPSEAVSPSSVVVPLVNHVSLEP